MKRVCIFCGANPGLMPDYVAAARQVGELLVEKKLTLVYGGASVGVMGKLADSVLKQGGQVIGVIPDYLVGKEVAHKGLTDLRVVDSMHGRKALMAELSDGFIAMPGGIGTLEEFFEVWTWAQIGLHDKPCGLLNVGNYFQKLISFLDHMVTQGFLRESSRCAILVDENPRELINQMEALTGLRSSRAINEKVL